MRRRLAILYTCAAPALIVLPSAGCSRFDAHADIYGRWRAEQLSLGGVALPVAPTMEFSSDKALIDGEQVDVEGYDKQDDKITVHLKASASLTFQFQGKDRMTLEVPLLGPVKYSRVN